jgi:hypothetical protein
MVPAWSPLKELAWLIINIEAKNYGSSHNGVGYFMNEIHGNGFAPFRFLTPFPNRPSSLYKRRAVGEKNRLKAERARFLSWRERRAKPETEQLLTRWGKSCVFSEPTGLSFSNILGGRFHRLPSMDEEGRLNLQGRFFHYRVFYLHNLDKDYN